MRSNNPDSLDFAKHYLELYCDYRVDVLSLLPFLEAYGASSDSLGAARAGAGARGGVMAPAMAPPPRNPVLELVLSRVHRLFVPHTPEINACYHMHSGWEVGARAFNRN